MQEFKLKQQRNTMLRRCFNKHSQNNLIAKKTQLLSKKLFYAKEETHEQ